jgi:hypothetical protein
VPILIVALVVMAVLYQVFFRYETHESAKNPHLMIERDSLTGNERVLKAGTQVTVMRNVWDGEESNASRQGVHRNLIEPITGEGQGRPINRVNPEEDTPSSAGSSPPVPPAPEEETTIASVDFSDHRQVEKVSRPVPVPREVVIASSAPPVPFNHADNVNTLADVSKAFAIRQVDLNDDGSIEEIIQNATQADGLLDISIVKDGREIFFGRGKRISLLPSRSQGWSDIVLKMGVQTLQVFRYDPKKDAYRALDHKS